jgi:hypothetical protein
MNVNALISYSNGTAIFPVTFSTLPLESRDAAILRMQNYLSDSKLAYAGRCMIVACSDEPIVLAPTARSLDRGSFNGFYPLNSVAEFVLEFAHGDVFLKKVGVEHKEARIRAGETVINASKLGRTIDRHVVTVSEVSEELAKLEREQKEHADGLIELMTLLGATLVEANLTIAKIIERKKAFHAESLLRAAEWEKNTKGKGVRIRRTNKEA